MHIQDQLKANEAFVNGKLKFSESLVIENKIAKVNKDQIINSFKEADGTTKVMLKPRIEAIHAGRTKNNTIYLKEKLQGDREKHSGVHSWTYPYPKPMIINHDTRNEPLGRITSAQYIEDSVTGKPCIVISPEITDKEAIEKLMDGRYLTVSVGCFVDSATCNICGSNVMEDWCEHYRGEEYDGVICGWVLGDLDFYECSFVNVPADQHAGVVGFDEGFQLEAYTLENNKLYQYNENGKNLVGQQFAEQLGLTPGVQNPGEGGPTMTLTPEMQKAIEDFIAAKTPDPVVPNVAIEELEATIVTLNASIATHEADIATKDAEIATKDADIAAKDAEIATKEESITSLTTEKESLIEAATEQSKECSEFLISVLSGISTEDFTDKSYDELKTILTAKITDLNSTSNQFKIDNPSIGNTEAEKESKKIAPEDALFALLTHNKNK